MIKLSAGLSKKVPMEEIQFSSRSASAAVEVELADGSEAEDIRARLKELYAVLEEAVDEQLGVAEAVAGRADCAVPVPSGGNGRKATERQLKAVRAIASERGLSEPQLQRLVSDSFGLKRPEELSVQEASMLIDTLKSKKGALS